MSLRDKTGKWRSHKPLSFCLARQVAKPQAAQFLFSKTSGEATSRPVFV